jgi:hypothetical protein
MPRGPEKGVAPNFANFGFLLYINIFLVLKLILVDFGHFGGFGAQKEARSWGKVGI